MFGVCVVVRNDIARVLRPNCWVGAIRSSKLRPRILARPIRFDRDAGRCPSLGVRLSKASATRAAARELRYVSAPSARTAARTGHGTDTIAFAKEGCYSKRRSPKGPHIGINSRNTVLQLAAPFGGRTDCLGPIEQILHIAAGVEVATTASKPTFTSSNEPALVVMCFGNWDVSPGRTRRTIEAPAMGNRKA